MKFIATLVVLLALIAAPSAALAQNTSTCQAYNPQLCTSQQSTGSSSGTLPFTGLNATWIVLAGGGLLGAGLVVRRVSRRLN